MAPNMFRLALGALSLLGSVLGAESTDTTTYKVTLDSYSAQLDYQPTSVGDPDETWSANFTDTPGDKWAVNVLGQGQGYHYSSNTSSWVGITWVGTAIEFWGYFGTPSESGSTGGARLIVDKEEADTTSGLLSSDPQMIISAKGLAPGNHTAELWVQDGTITFTHLVLSMDIPVTPDVWGQAEETTFNYATVNDGKAEPSPDMVMSDGNQWAAELSDGGAGGTAPVDYPRMVTNITNAAISYSLGTNNAFMMLNGTAAADHGVFDIDISPEPYGGKQTWNYWLYTAWTVTDAVLYAVALDPAENYTVTVTNRGGDGGDASYASFDVHSITSWKVPHTASKKTSTAAIAGGVVGGLAALAIIGAGIFFFLRRRRSKNRSRTVDNVEDKFIIDNDVAVSPFTHDSSNPPRGNGHLAPPSHGSEYIHMGPPSSSASPPPSSYAQSSAGGSSWGGGQTNAATSAYYESLDGQSSELGLVSPPPGATGKGPRTAPIQNITQEADGGAFVEEVVVPPSYDERWAEQRSAGGSTFGVHQSSASMSETSSSANASWPTDRKNPDMFRAVT